MSCLSAQAATGNDTTSPDSTTLSSCSTTYRTTCATLSTVVNSIRLNSFLMAFLLSGCPVRARVSLRQVLQRKPRIYAGKLSRKKKRVDMFSSNTLPQNIPHQPFSQNSPPNLSSSTSPPFQTFSRNKQTTKNKTETFVAITWQNCIFFKRVFRRST